MAIATGSNAPLQCVPFRPTISRKSWAQSSVICCRFQSKLDLKRKYLFVTDSNGAFSAVRLRASKDDYGQNESSSLVEQAKIQLSEARAMQGVIEKERDRLIEELSKSEAKKREYADIIQHNKTSALKELELVKDMFNKKLEQSNEEKFALESRLVLAKQDAVELAVQVEKLAELAFQQATSQIIKNAQLRVSAAETSAAEAARHIEEEIRIATAETISLIVHRSTDTINKALLAAEQAGIQVRKAATAVAGGGNLLDDVQTVRTKNIGLENTVSDLECRLLITRNEIDKLKSELDKTLANACANEIRASSAEKALAELQELIKKKSSLKDEMYKGLLEKMKKEAIERQEEAAKTFKSELETIMAAVEAAKETAHLKDEAYMRRYAALQRSLRASEAASEVWRQRAEIAESILCGERTHEDKLNYVNNGGRIDLLTSNDSKKWKLLAEGPRREIPDWMARRIGSIFPKVPPKKVDFFKALSTETLSLDLPKPDEVWPIAEEKPIQTSVFVDRVIEEETIEKKRKALERALQRKTVKSQRVPEQPKLEPGTGTGHEIMVSISLKTVQ